MVNKYNLSKATEKVLSETKQKFRFFVRCLSPLLLTPQEKINAKNVENKKDFYVQVVSSQVNKFLKIYI